MGSIRKGRYMKKAFCLVLTALLLLCSCNGEAKAPSVSTGAPEVQLVKGYKATNYSYMKAIWLSQYDLSPVLTDRGKQRDRQSFKKLMGRMLDNVRSLGLNTVIVQVRPFGDSFYPSEYFPMSAYAVGDYGNEASYDQLELIVEMAHLRGLSIHAWINPLRAMREDELPKIDDGYAVKAWYEMHESDMVSAVSGRLYINPAYSEARELVFNGVSEIVRNYDVDGVHIDDYFYPTTDESFDGKAYAEYISGGGRLCLADFRRKQIDLLVNGIYSAVKKENDSVVFGVSPSGVMKNNYEMLYADVEKWCAEEGYVDYICPQVYFGFEHSTCAFDKVCNEFSKIVKNNNVRLVIGMTLGKAEAEYDQYAGEGKYEWRDNKDVIRRSLEHVSKLDKCGGISFFSYQHFYHPVSGIENEKTAEEREAFLPIIKAEPTH